MPDAIEDAGGGGCWGLAAGSESIQLSINNPVDVAVYQAQGVPTPHCLP